MIAEAIRNGTYIPPAPIRPKGLGERPKLYELYLEMDAAAKEEELVGSSKQNGDWWRGIMVRLPFIVHCPVTQLRVAGVVYSPLQQMLF